MGKVAIINQNKAPLCDSISATAENPDYPVENLLTDAPAEIAIFPSTSVEIEFHYTTPQTFTGISLVNHNLPEGSTIQFIYSNDNFQNYTTIPLTWQSQIIWNQINVVNYVDFKLFISISSGYIQAGQLYLGTYSEFPTQPEFPIKHIPVENRYKSINEYGQNNNITLSTVWKKILPFRNVYSIDYLEIVSYLSGDEAKVLILDTNSREALQGRKVSEIASDQTVSGHSFNIDFQQNPYALMPYQE